MDHWEAAAERCEDEVCRHHMDIVVKVDIVVNGYTVVKEDIVVNGDIVVKEDSGQGRYSGQRG